jgi:prepilin-type N-terminal cleavage/methylation domain-containing protein
MSICRRDRGLTLLEALIVVLIVGVLAVLATAGYRKWIQTSYLAEAQNMVSNIRSAEESFYSENGAYLNVTGPNLGVGYDYPAATPGPFKMDWAGPCTPCATPTSWKALSVQTVGPVSFGYSLWADNTGTTAPPSIKIDGVSTSLAGMQGKSWYVIEADGDPRGTGTFTNVYGISANNQIFFNGSTQ